MNGVRIIRKEYLILLAGQPVHPAFNLHELRTCVRRTCANQRIQHPKLPHIFFLWTCGPT